MNNRRAEVRAMLATKHRVQTGQPARLLVLRARTTHVCAIIVWVSAATVAVLGGVWAVKCIIEGLGA